MEGVDIARVVIACQKVDALTHLVCRLVGESHTQDVAWQDPDFVDQIGKAAGQGACLSGTCPSDYPDKSFRRGDRLQLGRIQPLEFLNVIIILRVCILFVILRVCILFIILKVCILFIILKVVIHEIRFPFYSEKSLVKKLSPLVYWICSCSSEPDSRLSPSIASAFTSVRQLSADPAGNCLSRRLSVSNASAFIPVRQLSADSAGSCLSSRFPLSIASAFIPVGQLFPQGSR